MRGRGPAGRGSGRQGVTTVDYDARMLEMLRDLVAHKGHANATMLGVIGTHEAIAADPDVSALLHHVLLANRFWILTILGRPFDVEVESRISPSFDDLVRRFADVQTLEATWLASADGSDLDRILRDPQIPGDQCTVAQACVQVCLHSHGHRAQIAKRVRFLGVVPPPTDFINWLPGRPAALWPSGQ